MTRKASLLHADPIHFSPIYLSANTVSTEKLLPFYRFLNIFFPKIDSSLVKKIMDMERHGERLKANSSPEEREKLIRQMNCLSVNIQLTVSDEEEKIMEMSVRIVPSEVLERAQQGRNDLIHCPRLSDDLEKLVVKLITKEVSSRFATKLADGFQALTGFRQVPSFITQLLEIGALPYFRRTYGLFKNRYLSQMQPYMRTPKFGQVFEYGYGHEWR
ncbi:MAG: hypothetical protein KFB96_00075 [Thiocapsa sp.]|uniref:hypothetical protein n=1 Tax=Thiocapsa sp. TaxID=2024551 RepID=UPI001BCF6505|nr:hypothetical protein [Thiocapsa sp.]QVL48983.1 MAG: hypothetical protein KFB96_00075 [Thiocapsa sp.]